MGAVQRLVATWEQRGTALNPGASNAELDELRVLLGGLLPEDIREFYSLANGMPNGTYDDHQVSFWSISKIRDQQRDYGGSQLGFADFLLYSWRFIFQVADAGVVVVSENVPPGQAMDTLGGFDDFLEIYLTDPSRLR